MAKNYPPKYISFDHLKPEDKRQTEAYFRDVIAPWARSCQSIVEDWRRLKRERWERARDLQKEQA